MKDIKRLCNCIQCLSYQHIKENEKEKHRLNVHKKLLLELNKVFDRC